MLYIGPGIKQYITKYSVNDTLGTIAKAHIVFADKEMLKAISAHAWSSHICFRLQLTFQKQIME
ncbi:hypothetical protein ARALYDRAFT_905454 [Arabidopsis lyrata subsp. lyrata]|uniref:Uncharacterized protein n=1 Tax=Arabidopsis lyrata subsp. lyrata TaxID=81972 RepID=D7LMC5_ARALL|nr:hypothetical protein ARALYDRAFT_905454 [Arabidopsis lyrata subsp. lyrata]